MNVESRKKELAGKIYDWQRGGTFFTAQLFSLMGKASLANLNRIRDGFPEEVEIFAEWKTSLCEYDFFDKYGIETIAMRIENGD